MYGLSYKLVFFKSRSAPNLFQLREFVGVSVEDLVSLVRENDKKRFTLKTDEETGLLKVRANQGHSIAVGKLDIKKISR